MVKTNSNRVTKVAGAENSLAYKKVPQSQEETQRDMPSHLCKYGFTVKLGGGSMVNRLNANSIARAAF